MHLLKQKLLLILVIAFTFIMLCPQVSFAGCGGAPVVTTYFYYYDDISDSNAALDACLHSSPYAGYYPGAPLSPNPKYTCRYWDGCTICPNCGCSGDCSPCIWNEHFYYISCCSGTEEVTTDKDNLQPGETAHAQMNGGGSVTWDIVGNNDSVHADIDQSGNITNTSGNGTVIIRGRLWQGCEVTKPLQIGCNQCGSSGNGSSPGASCSGPKLHSIDLLISLGQAERGNKAGYIALQSKDMGPNLATPKALTLFSNSRYVKSLLDGNTYRQIKAPETFVDIVTIDPYSYTINFYKPEARGAMADHFYQIISGSIPIATWKIENPDASPTIYNRLRITETRNGTGKVYEYVFDSGQNTWTLNKGNGLQVIAKKTEINGDLRIVTETLKDNAGIPASKKITTYKTLEYSGTTKEVIISEVIDPDNAALTTTSTYYEGPSCPSGSCGRLQSQVNPDGSWVNYLYDTLGRKTLEISSYLDVAPTTDPAAARAVYYDYTPLTGDSNKPEDKYQPRKITEKILANTFSLTYYVYQVATNGERTEIMEQALSPSAAYGAVANLRTITVTNPYNATLPNSWKTKSITYPDAKLDTYTYEYGTYIPNGTQPGTFTTGAGTDMRTTLIHGTVASPAGIANKTLREISIVNKLGREQMRETQVYTGSGYEQIQWQATLYDSNNRPSDIYSSDGTHQQTNWGCCNLEAETNAQGIHILYAGYDGLGRLLTKIKTGSPDLYYTYAYDAAGRRLSETASSNGLILSTGQIYDLAGRMLSSIDPAGLVTAYSYDLNGLRSTVTRPGGFTEITDRYLDGRIKNITGTGLIPKYYEYGVNADGSQYTKVYNSSLTSPQWEKSTTDMLGRPLKIEKPGFTATEAAQYFYNSKGQLIKVTQPGMADTLYEYDEINNQTRTGLDINANAILDNNSNDRITETLTSFTKPDSNWWRQSIRKVYSQDNNATATTISTQRTRLTSLGVGGLITESIATDVHGNQTISITTLDPSTKTLSQSIDYPDAAIDAETVNINGLVMSQKTKTGVITTFEYDALGRKTVNREPRTGSTITHYNNLNQVDYIEDPAQNRTSYTYDPQTGRKIAETNALNKTTYYTYNNLGQVTRVWGAAEPVEYVYDNYGRLSELHTFRQGSNWQSPTWPDGNTGTPDITKWHYQESTGLLLSKEYADGKSTTYTYTTGGKLLTRTWARTDQGNPLVTTYTYDPKTGELLNIDYSDSTPDVTFTYDRLGRQKTVTDYVGNRTFSYNANTLQLETESITGLYNKVITRTYETSGVPGRNNGFTLGADYSVSYGYETDTGRFKSLSWNITNQTNGTNQTGSANYSYLTNSELISGYTSSNGLAVSYSYENNRNLKTQVKNEFGTNVVSQYDYLYNQIGNRTQMNTSGSAFTATPNFTQQNTTYLTNNLNQYNKVTDQFPQPTENNLNYDEDGNLVSIIKQSEGAQYSYNAENQLIKVEPIQAVSGTTKVEFAYDYMGRRVEKKAFAYNSGSWLLTSDSLFLYDGWNLVSEQITRNPQPVTEKLYINGLDLSQSLQGAGGIGGLIASIDTNANKMYYYLSDANGNVGQLFDSTDGSLTAHYEYDPYGNITVKSGSYADTNPYRFSSKYFDNETGLLYYGYRYYAPSLGRWISRDPNEEQGGANLYAFVANNPINSFDILGQWGTDVHLLATSCWAEELGYPPTAANAIGQADNAVDSGGTSYWPIYGDQSYHFDRNRGQGRDTRMQHYDEHFQAAEQACTGSKDDPEKAAKELGTALHSYQDWVAHGDYGYLDNGQIWHPHNSYSPQKTWGAPTAYPDIIWLDAVDGPNGRPSGPAMHVVKGNQLYAIYAPGNQRIYLTRAMTAGSLIEFSSYIKNNGGCKCKKYFGVN